MKTVLVILDGFGIGKDSPFNAIQNAHMPFYRELESKQPFTRLLTHGSSVGLPDGIMGNSEVGHMTIGSGRVLYQDLVRINQSIQKKEFSKHPLLKKAFRSATKSTARLHLVGLVSDGGVHSHIDHLNALLDACLEEDLPRVCVHAILDGRDTPPDSGAKFIESLLGHPAFKKNAKLASLSGRYWAMDRDQRWDRIKKAFDTWTGKTTTVNESPGEIIQNSYSKEKGDEFLEPVLFGQENGIQKDDTVIFFNFRADRARQMTEMLNGKGGIQLANLTTMTEYDSSFGLPVLFEPEKPNLIFGQLLETKGLRQFRVAETEKYAHVTFFFNCGREEAFKGEERILIPSPKDVPTYDQKPEMSALSIADEATNRIHSGHYDFVLMNFANADMVGHTGKYDAAVKAMETLDHCLDKVVGAAQKSGYEVLITADHGNAEEMQDSKGRPHTQHTLNPVPLIWVPCKREPALLEEGTLADIIPTLCTLMNFPQPPEMTGRSLVKC